MRRLSQFFRGCAIASLIALCSNVQAAPLAPGGTIPAPAEVDPTGGVIQAGTGATVPFSAGGPAGYSGTLTSTVIAGDPSNLLGGLTFTYRLTNDATSLSALERMTNIDFTGFQTDVSYQAPAAGVIPTTADRDPAGGAVGWDFAPLGLGRINPGQASALLVIQTNATAFAVTNANIIDGQATSVSSFGPVPEPGSLAVLSLGALAAIRRRRV
jgi:hypothetical protein